MRISAVGGLRLMSESVERFPPLGLRLCGDCRRAEPAHEEQGSGEKARRHNSADEMS